MHCSVSVCCLLQGLMTLGAASSIYAGPLPAMQLRKVAETGMAAPGTEPGVVFGALTTSLNHSLLIPRMDENGRVAFMGVLAGPGIDLSNFQGMWAEESGSLRLVARNGQDSRLFRMAMAVERLFGG